MALIFLTVGEVLEIHGDQIKRYGGDPGVRDIGLLESAVAAPAAEFEGHHLHADLFSMAAAYMFHIIQNHPFVDGNKRTGAVATLVFLGMNGSELVVAENEFEALVWSVAKGEISKSEIAEFLSENIRDIVG